MTDKKAIIFDIQRNSCVDGPGLRTTVFFKGCNLSCAWCHNPESHKKTPQIAYYKNKCSGCGKCKEVCPNSLEKCDLCGRCISACPMNLMPSLIYQHAMAGETAECKKLNVTDCIECGCCSYACLGKLYLVQAMRMAKANLTNDR